MPPDHQKPLRRDIRMLGDLLGEVLREQEGDELFAVVERLRAATKKLRRRFSAAEQAKVRRMTARLDVRSMNRVLRAFATYLQLANTAEQQHRIRRLRAQRFESGGRPPRGSLQETLEMARRKGVGAAELAGVFDRLLIMPVFTAHPTEATRRTVLEKHSRIWDLLDRLERSQRTP